MSPHIILATRKSPLALKQTELTRKWLLGKMPGSSFAELPMSTSGDEQLNWSLEKSGGKGLFTRELENALLDGRASIAVHSAKDLPTEFQPGLAIAGYLPRARANDILAHHKDHPAPDTIATSSPRRRAQLAIQYPKSTWSTIRGNVETRLKKIADGHADATLLAAAGLERLGIHKFEKIVFKEMPIEVIVPAPGQAAIAVQSRVDEVARYAPLLCQETYLSVSLERAFLGRLGGGCQTPVGAHYSNGTLQIFHPDVGHCSFTLNLKSLNDVQTALDKIFSEIKIGG